MLNYELSSTNCCSNKIYNFILVCNSILGFTAHCYIKNIYIYIYIIMHEAITFLYVAFMFISNMK